MENRSPGGDAAAPPVATSPAAVAKPVSENPHENAIMEEATKETSMVIKGSNDATMEDAPATAIEPAEKATEPPPPPPPLAEDLEDVDMEDAEPVALVGTTPPVLGQEKKQASVTTPVPPSALTEVEKIVASSKAKGPTVGKIPTPPPVYTEQDAMGAHFSSIPDDSFPPFNPSCNRTEVNEPNIPGTPPPPATPVTSRATSFVTPARVPHDLQNIIRAAQQTVEKTMRLQEPIPPSPIIEPGALHELGDIHSPDRRRSSATAGIAGLEELRNRMEQEAGHRSRFDQLLEATEVNTEQLNEDGQPIIKAFLRIDFADGNVYYVKSPSVVFGRADGSAGVSVQHVGKNGTTIMETGPRGFGRLPVPGEFLDKPEKKKRKKKKKLELDLRKNKASSSGASSTTPGPGQSYIGFQEPPGFRNPFGHIETTDGQEEPVIHLPLKSWGENVPVRKNISRRHARLFFNQQKSRFEFEVLGKNGAFVDDEYVQTGTNIVVEQKGLKVQIGGITFSIIVPPGIYAEKSERSTSGKDLSSFHGGKMSFSFHDEHGNEIQTDAYGSDNLSDESGDGDSGEQSDEDEGEADEEGESEEEDEEESEDEIEPSPSPEPVIEKKRGRGRPKNSDLEKARKLKAKEAQKEQERLQEQERRRKKEKERLEAVRREKEKREKEKQKQKEKEEREKKRLAEQRKQEELKEQREKQKAEKKREREKEKLAKKVKKLYLPTVPGQEKPEATPPLPSIPKAQPPPPPPNIDNEPTYEPVQEPQNDPASIMAPIPYQDPQQPVQVQPPPQPQPQPIGQYAIDPSLFEQQMAPPPPQPIYHPPPKERRPKPPPRKIERNHSPEPQESDYTEEQLMKPTCSYVVMCHDAIKNSPNQMLSLPEIYKAIERKYPYYKFRVNTNGWQSSVRHNLGQNKAFRKVERSGKGWMWGVVEGVSIEKERKGALPKPPMMYPPPMNGMYLPQTNGQLLNAGMGIPQAGYLPQPQGMQPPQSQAFNMSAQQVPVPPAYLPRPLPTNTITTTANNPRPMEAPIPHPTAGAPTGPPELAEYVKRIITLLTKLIAQAKPHAPPNATLASLIIDLEKLIASLQTGSPLDKNTTASMNNLVSQIKTHIPSANAASASSTMGATSTSPSSGAASVSPVPTGPAGSPPPPVAVAPAAVATNPKLQHHMDRIKNMSPEEKAALTQKLLAMKQRQAAQAAQATQATAQPSVAVASISASTTTTIASTGVGPVPPATTVPVTPVTTTAPTVTGSTPGSPPAGKVPVQAVSQISSDILQQAMANVNAKQQTEGSISEIQQSQPPSPQGRKRPAEGPPTADSQPAQKKVDVGVGAA